MRSSLRYIYMSSWTFLFCCTDLDLLEVVVVFVRQNPRALLVLVVTRDTQSLVLTLQDCRSTADPTESLGGDGRAVGSNGGADGHEEAENTSQRMLATTGSATCPNVAAEPIMYWPSVRSIPLGPGPKRTILVKPTKSESSYEDS